MKRNILGLIIGATVYTGSVVLLPLATYQIGKLEARLDLLRGKRISKRCVEFSGKDRDLAQALDSAREREFGMKVVVTPGCDDEAVYWQGVGYNIQQYDDLVSTYGEAKVNEVSEKIMHEYFRKLESEPE